MPSPPPKCAPKCPCYDNIDLSDEDSEEEPLPIPEPPIDPTEPGASQEELDNIRNELQDLLTVVSDLNRTFEENQMAVNNNFMKLE
jgi:hypothetical protein